MVEFGASGFGAVAEQQRGPVFEGFSGTPLEAEQRFGEDRETGMSDGDGVEGLVGGELSVHSAGNPY